jgi:hypothetical protein
MARRKRSSELKCHNISSYGCGGCGGLWYKGGRSQGKQGKQGCELEMIDIDVTDPTSRRVWVFRGLGVRSRAADEPMR